MPKKSGKLDAKVIADFEHWISVGAPDPRDMPPTAQELERSTSWAATLQKRKQWWSFQPIGNPTPPRVDGNHWSDHPIDRFILAKLHEKGLEPAEAADARTLVRRLYFALIGLPPTPAEFDQWSARLANPAGYADLVDHLLDSPHFGERWARHWMDWVRYAESHGSEGDPPIDNAWVYRDYLIRALNADVSFDQLVREHIAGDLLGHPRINAALGINESMIGPAHWRMVFHGFAPTDALEEKVRFIDDEIGTFSKAFLGLTVSCARCHDHKFDPIGQRDYYALFGVLASCRPGRNAIDTPERLNANRGELAALKPRIRSAIAEDWLAAAAGLKARLLHSDGAPNGAQGPSDVLGPWAKTRKEATQPADFARAWGRQTDAWQADRDRRDVFARQTKFRSWHLGSSADYASWFHQGTGLPAEPSRAGEFAVAPSGDTALTGVYPAGAYSHALSAKHSARFSSGYIHLDDNYELYVRAIGEGGASVRYVVQDYPRNGSVYPVAKLTNEWKWQPLSMAYWNGDEVHVELCAAKDAPVLVGPEARSWFGVRDVTIVRKGDPAPPEAHEALDPIFERATAAPPTNLEALSDRYQSAIAAAVRAWRDEAATDAQALLLDACLNQGVLPNELGHLPTAAPLIATYRELEVQIVVPTRVPGLEETVGRNQRLLARGNHKQPAEEVPRAFLEAIDGTPYTGPLSGRRQLAEDVLRDTNPLTRRVIANRLWHHLFSRGIVATPDNFGRLGLEPTHPELLDFLATRFKEQGGSMKDQIRFIVTSKTWQLSSRPSPESMQRDPDNLLLSHAPVRRLEAEAIRDSLLDVSGSLDETLFGSPVDGGSARRSIYVGVKRTALDPFLRSFDFPEPFSATGRRDVTNVPAQSLTLMNDEHVAALAAAWAARILSEGALADDEARIRGMFVAALSRPPAPAEVDRFKAYLDQSRRQAAAAAAQIAELHDQANKQEAVIQSILAPVRDRVSEKALASSAATAPKPIAWWDFQADLRDSIGQMHGAAVAGARIETGGLVVNQQGYVITSPLGQSIREKTLEAGVQLDSLSQKGGGVMTLQTVNGAVFDAIVFGEKEPGCWIAGSDFFHRSKSFDGPAELDAIHRPILLTVTYAADGTVAAYRDGKPYGKPYRTSGPIEFKIGEAVVGFGVRHLPAGGNKHLAGKIYQAKLYDRALTPEEVARTAAGFSAFLNGAEVEAALSEAERQRVAEARNRWFDLRARIARLSPADGAADEKAIWADVARAIFTFKEFIYLR